MSSSLLNSLLLLSFSWFVLCAVAVLSPVCRYLPLLLFVLLTLPLLLFVLSTLPLLLFVLFTLALLLFVLLISSL
jgi:hypothetical protein